jgi:exodeoxyribonuclease V beta subunit
MINFEPLNKDIVKLSGANIVEASAGTGKTYSIGLLVLRLILEKNVPISRILMVTFTNQALAELAARIREFIRHAIKAHETGVCNEKPIQQLMLDHTEPLKLLRLKEALSELDEAAIQTIHSFCQEALNKFALESGQAFSLELQPDVLQIANEYVKVFWRNNISGLPLEDIQEWNKYLKINNFNAIIKEALGGKTFALEELSNPTEYREELKQFEKHFLKNKAKFESQIQNLKIKGIGPGTKTTAIEKLENLDSFRSLLSDEGERNSTICSNLFQNEINTSKEINRKYDTVIYTLFLKCINEIKVKIQTHLLKKHLLTYDEIITRMHTAVIKNNEFRKVIRQHYDAVFIDEFQDTDKLQYEIYDNLFGDDKILFYIGDPKQSIYAWRKADLNTYFAARKKIPVANRFKMEINFRSTIALVNAVNEFYYKVDDPFKTGGDEKSKIEYQNVQANNKTSKGLTKENVIVKPLQVFIEKKQDDIRSKLLCLVQDLLSGNYKLDSKDIVNSDIGILVRTNDQGKEIKGILANAGYHAVTIDDSKIFEDSAEAKALLCIMEAILNTNEANINKALLNRFTNKKSGELLGLEKEGLLEKFREYRDLWYSSGINAAFRYFMSHFDVVRILMEKNDLRTLTNLTQILELLQEAEYRHELKPFGLYAYLQKQIAGSVEEGDEMEQRVESDDDAIQILTIHKSKGLEYPIVIAPYLDMTSNETHDYCSFRDAEGIYKFYPKGKGNDESSKFFEEQKSQENCRLLYVALTRTKYNCFIFKNEYFKENSVLFKFPFKKFSQGEGFIELPEKPSTEKGKMPPFKDTWGQGLELKEFALTDKYYGKLSFSALSAHSSHPLPEKLDKYENDYDKFIFKDIPGGKNMGTMLHYLFENINFTNPKDHQAEVDKLVNKYYPGKKEMLRERLVEMVDHVLHSHIQFPDGTNIILRNLDSAAKLNEMQFDLSMEDICLADLKGFDLGKDIDINCNMAISTQKGLLTGLIDLFFEHNGKYYILDWKSNYLGDHLDHYAAGDTMRKALNEGNYHLQYLIYSMAVKNYLEARLPEFDYDKHFGGAIYVYLRGARKGTEHGIYTNRPSLEQVETLERIFRKSVTA